jgi:hypothetical protein
MNADPLIANVETPPSALGFQFKSTELSDKI